VTEEQVGEEKGHHHPIHTRKQASLPSSTHPFIQPPKSQAVLTFIIRTLGVFIIKRLLLSSLINTKM
jgi:hypothetical protein